MAILLQTDTQTGRKKYPKTARRRVACITTFLTRMMIRTADDAGILDMAAVVAKDQGRAVEEREFVAHAPNVIHQNIARAPPERSSSQGLDMPAVIKWKHLALCPQKPLRLIRDGEVAGSGNFYI